LSCVDRVVLSRVTIGHEYALFGIFPPGLLAPVAQGLVLSDRGYPAFWLFARHYPLERDYCPRLPLGFST
jgi:hypothetical protein